MSYRSCELDGLYVVRWGANKPNVSDITAYANEIEAARERQGKPLVGLFIMPPDAGAPDDTFRKAQANKLPSLMSNLDYAIAVFEGTGFFSSLKRSALVAILLLAPRRHPVYVRATIEDALVHKPPKRITFDATKALGELRRRGMLSDPPALRAGAA